ncbi:hypothetical protein NADFUDRAFT_82250 [Nadsonia fulvescens var. elongata DSM 6958]|uniref:Uncharacterized protein n=1 Tax=Nadsonia fulvescens var. elongata DSM 6958 TaxID=857566 RepID=A0A1E3PNJ3_9ASCO|nr:hypothetical protein NADFUDRAFT_82250 [Nadsonia fulvescens var. elongata DSM 6958]
MKSEKSDVGPVSNTPSSSELGRPLVGSVPIVPPKVNKSQNTTSSTILAPKGLEMKAATTPSPKSSFVPCGKYLYMSDSTSSISRRG